jgi:hypothetical protein
MNIVPNVTIQRNVFTYLAWKKIWHMTSNKRITAETFYTKELYFAI